MQKQIHQMNDEEIAKFIETIKKNWYLASSKDLELAIRYNRRLVQQFKVRLEVLEELLSVKRPDNKSKQYAD